MTSEPPNVPSVVERTASASNSAVDNASKSVMDKAAQSAADNASNGVAENASNGVAENVVELSELTVRLGGRTVLDRLNAKLTGRALGLLGPNGAGKSTLLNTLLGFHAPSAGHAKIFGHDCQRRSDDVRALTGYMPENDAFIASMSGIRFVRYMAELSGIPAREALERAHEIFVYVGLGEARYRTLGSYSIGMKQVVKLAQAMVHGPRLVFLDEPTNGLDPSARERMIQLIKQVRDAGETRLLISSHLLHDVEECCDEVLILKRGRIAAQANLEEQRRSKQKYLEFDTSAKSEAFLDAVMRLGCDCASFPGAAGASRVRVVLPKDVEMRTLYVLAERHGVLIRRMSQRRDSLEELFFQAMRDEDAPMSPPSSRQSVEYGVHATEPFPPAESNGGRL